MTKAEIVNADKRHTRNEAVEPTRKEEKKNEIVPSYNCGVPDRDIVAQS